MKRKLDSCSQKKSFIVNIFVVRNCHFHQQKNILVGSYVFNYTVISEVDYFIKNTDDLIIF